MDVTAWISEAARAQPQRVFIRDTGGRSLTYADLARESLRLAGKLASRGVSPGDRVAVQVDKSLDAVVLYAACLASGAIYVPINTAYTAPEVEHILVDARPRMAVVRPADVATLEDAAARARVDCMETLGAAGEGTLASLAAHGTVDPSIPGAARSIAAIIYTSGTTGRAKGAMLTRGNLASNAAALARAWRFSPDDVLLHTLPLFHVHGLFAAINTVLAARASLVLMPKFDAGAVIAALPSASVYMGVPTHYTRLLSEPSLGRETTSHVRLFVSGSAPLRAETHREFATRTGQHILERYGMTETLMITSNPYDGPRVPGSVGPALPGVSVRVADPKAGIGMLEVQGPNVFAGYWDDAPRTQAEFTADGWFKTGDLGCIDRDGYVSIVGRAKDLVISGGFNVYPKEVESALDALPEVMESAVFGVPHPDLGEGVTAAVVLRAGVVASEAPLLAALRGRLAGYKIPKRVVFIPALPRNTMGKIEKNVLRSSYSDLYRAA